MRRLKQGTLVQLQPDRFATHEPPDEGIEEKEGLLWIVTEDDPRIVRTKPRTTIYTLRSLATRRTYNFFRYEFVVRK